MKPIARILGLFLLQTLLAASAHASVGSRDADINMEGAKVEGENITLAAARDLNLYAAQNSAEIASRERASSAMVGATFGFGQQSGLSFQGAFSNSRGQGSGSATTYDNTVVTASGTLSMSSGRDTNLMGAQVAGDSVRMDVGRDLALTTLQDQSSYHSSQESSGIAFSLCVYFCVGASSVSFNSSSQSIDHNYFSATGQTGIAAGTGGFDIRVAGHTALTGAAITSAADQDNNHLSTGTLSYTDLSNTQHTDVASDSFSAGFSSGASAVSTIASNVTANLASAFNAGAGLPGNQDQNSQTQSVISPAHITITSGDPQSQEAVATLTSRDAQTANQGLTDNLTLQQAQDIARRQRQAQENAQAAQMVGEVLTNIDWGRYAEIFSYNDQTEIFSLEDVET